MRRPFRPAIRRTMRLAMRRIMRGVMSPLSMPPMKIYVCIIIKYIYVHMYSIYYLGEVSFQGLCMGFSLISVAEMFFHCFISFCKRRAENPGSSSKAINESDESDNGGGGQFMCERHKKMIEPTHHAEGRVDPVDLALKNRNWF
jgi:hypothetical protein